MIEFKVTGETWKEIRKNLEGMFPESEPTKVSETVENPPNSFTTQGKLLEVTASQHPPGLNLSATPPSDPPVVDASPSDAPIPFEPPEPVVLPSHPGLPTLDLDIMNIPWNPDIHTRTKSKNDDGTWRKKRQSPHFEKKETILPPGTGIKSKSAVETPQPTALPEQFQTIETLMLYVNKINASGKGNYETIQQYLNSLGIQNVMQIAPSELPKTAMSLLKHFGVPYQ